MPQIKQKYTLGPRHQLIDLNKELVNFRLEFQVIADDPNKEFDALVVEQGQLDATPDMNALEMKGAKGRIGGSILADKNSYQNYFLVLRSTPGPVEVEVSIALEELLPTPVITSTEPPQASTLIPFYRQQWFMVLVVGLVVGALLYYYLFHKREKDSEKLEVVAPPAAAAAEDIHPDVSLYSKLRSIS